MKEVAQSPTHQDEVVVTPMVEHFTNPLWTIDLADRNCQIQELEEENRMVNRHHHHHLRVLTDLVIVLRSNMWRRRDESRIHSPDIRPERQKQILEALLITIKITAV